jgi:hypothetical protein
MKPIGSSDEMDGGEDARGEESCLISTDQGWTTDFHTILSTYSIMCNAQAGVFRKSVSRNGTGHMLARSSA